MEQKKDNHYVREEHKAQDAQGQQNNNKTNDLGYIMRKAEKLTTALYLVSDIMSDREPMKWTMRETGVDILSDVTVSSPLATRARITDLRYIMKKIESIIAFLDIAQSTRMISEMNARVLKKEYVGLRHDVEAEWNRTDEQSRVVLNESFFNVPHVEELSSGSKEDVANGGVRKGVNFEPTIQSVTPLREVGTPSARTNTTPLAPVVPMTGGKREEIKVTPKESRVHVERLPYKKFARPDFLDGAPVLENQSTPVARPDFLSGTSALENRSTPVVRPIFTLHDAIAHARTDVVRPRSLERQRLEIGSTLVVRDDRRKIILALIKQKPEIAVKDITKSISGVSEKTIQRELLAMVAEGILEKHGERRWSTYGIKGG